MLEFAPMSDPLSIPDGKRAGSGHRRLSDARRKHPWTFWTTLVVVLALNGWYDYYHPVAILFDIIIVIILAAKWLT